MSTFMNPLPPQAYTKETLVHAYAWLQNQSENIKELATTPDVLVSLYLKAKLQGDGALERPSIQNFKNELKNLAGMMGEFEVLDAPVVNGSNNSGHQTVRIRSQDLRANEIKVEEKPVVMNAHPRGQAHSGSAATTQTSVTFTSTSSSASASAYAPPPPTYTPPPPSYAHAPSDTASEALPRLDSRSLDMIQEVKIQFNLSTDAEAQRLLLAIGYNSVKGLLR